MVGDQTSRASAEWRHAAASRCLQRFWEGDGAAAGGGRRPRGQEQCEWREGWAEGRVAGWIGAGGAERKKGDWELGWSGREAFMEALDVRPASFGWFSLFFCVSFGMLCENTQHVTQPAHSQITTLLLARVLRSGDRRVFCSLGHDPGHEVRDGEGGGAFWGVGLLVGDHASRAFAEWRHAAASRCVQRLWEGDGTAAGGRRRPRGQEQCELQEGGRKRRADVRGERDSQKRGERKWG